MTLKPLFWRCSRRFQLQRLRRIKDRIGRKENLVNFSFKWITFFCTPVIRERGWPLLYLLLTHRSRYYRTVSCLFLSRLKTPTHLKFNWSSFQRNIKFFFIIRMSFFKEGTTERLSQFFMKIKTVYN